MTLAISTSTSERVLSARLERRAAQSILVVLALAVLAYAGYGLAGALHAPSAVNVVYLSGLAMMAWDLLLGVSDRELREPTGGEQEELDRQRVVTLVPVYNEDDAALRGCLASLLRQSRPPDAVCVVDDGSTTGDYGAVRDWFRVEGRRRGIRVFWDRVENGGKRRAQVTGLRHEPDATVIMTVDSDTVVDPQAVAKGLRPFADTRVQSVAGVVLTRNYAVNLLTRIQELAFTGAQLVTRRSLSRMGSVQVNCGGLAFYRAAVLVDNLDAYLSETCLGRPVHASDDSLLTLFALARGRTVQQCDAFAFTLMPTTLSHHRRQQLRWMRGSTVRSAWRFRYLPTNRYAFWQHLAKWAQFGAGAAIAAVLLGSGLLFRLDVLAWTALIAVGAALLLNTPYLALHRSDQTLRQRVAVFAAAPLVGIWQLTFMRVLRWYAILTFPKVATGWGTRSTVEVTAEGLRGSKAPACSGIDARGRP